MTVGLHELLREVHRERTEAYRADAYEKAPESITLAPATFDDVLLDDSYPTYPSSPVGPAWPEVNRPQLFGIDLKEDRDLPVDVVVLRWKSGRLVVLRKLETTQWRAMVRDGVSRAHPWLRLPPPVPHKDPEKRWVRWTFPASTFRRAWLTESRIGMQVIDVRTMTRMVIS